MPDVPIGDSWLRSHLDPVRPTILVVAMDAPRARAPCKIIHLPQPTLQCRSLLGLKGPAWLLIRPDGHLAARGVALETLEAARLMRLAPTEALG